MKQLMKGIAMTDIHWGGKSGSLQHNEDCLAFIEWFTERVRQDDEVDHILFLGDWFDHRSAINVETLNYSYRGAKMLNDLGLPVYFIVGNHDMYHRHSRDVYSTIQFNEFENFVLINEPTIIEEIGDGGALMCPYLFHHEYEMLAKFKHLKTWWGHFEFKGFIVTGHSVVMPTGPEAEQFEGPWIFSGHFHKRQAHKKTVYIGNAFPMNFSDAGDYSRGLCKYNHVTDEIEFEDWEDCPKYQKVTLSSLIDQKVVLLKNARVKCIVDIDISFEESTKLKQSFITKYKLREFSLEESKDVSNALKFSDGNVEEDSDIDNDELKSVDELIMEMLHNVEAPQIDKGLLIQLYRGVH